MTATNNKKKFILLGIFFSVMAIAFALLYHFKVIKTLDLYLSVTYVLYFVGIALLYNGGLHKENGHIKAKKTSFIFAALFIVAALVLLIYGFINGQISF